jgi:two-component system phosphate regulon sensor histidine kinase PhoR
MQREINYDFYIENLQEMAQLFQQINWDASEKDFLDKLLKIAIKIIPEAECGSIWLIKGALYKAIVGEGYDQELLSKMEVPLSEAFVNKYMKSDILEVKNIMDYNTPETELHKISRTMHKNNKNMVTLIATLKYGDNVAGHIYIDSFSR